jgi:hypothetical protein
MNEKISSAKRKYHLAEDEKKYLGKLTSLFSQQYSNVNNTRHHQINNKAESNSRGNNNIDDSIYSNEEDNNENFIGTDQVLINIIMIKIIIIIIVE